MFPLSRPTWKSALLWNSSDPRCPDGWRLEFLLLMGGWWDGGNKKGDRGLSSHASSSKEKNLLAGAHNALSWKRRENAFPSFNNNNNPALSKHQRAHRYFLFLYTYMLHLSILGGLLQDTFSVPGPTLWNVTRHFFPAISLFQPPVACPCFLFLSSILWPHVIVKGWSGQVKSII